MLDDALCGMHSANADDFYRRHVTPNISNVEFDVQHLNDAHPVKQNDDLHLLSRNAYNSK